MGKTTGMIVCGTLMLCLVLFLPPADARFRPGPDTSQVFHHPAVVTFALPAIDAPNPGIPVRLAMNDQAGSLTVPSSYSTLSAESVILNQTAIGLAFGTPYTFSASGGSPPYTWERNPTTNSALTPSDLPRTTAVFTATAAGVYTVTVTDSASSTKTATVEVIAPIVIGGKPNKDAVKSGVTNVFAATGGHGVGTYVWEVTTGATGGSINAMTGLFTANTVTTATPVTIRAYDATWNKTSVTPIFTPYSFTVYPTVAITNKPATPPTFNSGENSMVFRAAGGDGTYTWSVSGPVALASSTGAFYQFSAPAVGNFAGLYTITVTDGKDFIDSFTLYVTLKLVAWRAGSVIAPVMYTGVAGYELRALGVPAGTGLTVTKDNPASGVLSVPATTTDNPFGVTANIPGADYVTVRVTDDVDGKFKGGLRVDVLGRAILTGTIGNIPSDLDKSNIIVQLLDPATKAALDPYVYGAAFVGINSSSGYAFTGFGGAGIPWQAYWLQVMVNDPQYVPVIAGRRILVSSVAATENVTLPAMTKQKCDLTVNLSGQYAPGDLLTYKLFLASSGELALEGTTTAPAGNFTVMLERKNYRLIITGAKYLPFEYEDAMEPRKFIKIAAGDVTKQATVNLTRLPAMVMASHTQVNGGFTLNVATKNFTGTYAHAVNGVGTTTFLGGSGSEAAPYLYNWTPTGGGGVDEFGNTVYRVNFTFTCDGMPVMNPDGTPYTYTAVFTMYASDETKNDAKNDSGDVEEQDHWKDQRDAAGTDTTLFVFSGEREFFPLVGTDFMIAIKDVTGADRVVMVAVPPLPLEYLYIDDYDMAGPSDRLLYGGLKMTPGSTDRYNRTRASAMNIMATDILRMKVEYATIGGGALSNVVSIGLETRDGVRVRYNPLLKNDSGAWVRDAVAPRISLQLLLNPKAILFKSLQKLSQAKGKLVPLDSELGDGVDGFKVENLPFMVQDDGLVWVDINHLTSITLGGSTGGASSAGDINGDQQVTLADAVLALQIIGGLDTTGKTVFLGAEVNNDWRIDLTEAIFILQKAAGLRQ